MLRVSYKELYLKTKEESDLWDLQLKTIAKMIKNPKAKDNLTIAELAEILGFMDNYCGGTVAIKTELDVDALKKEINKPQEEKDDADSTKTPNTELLKKYRVDVWQYHEKVDSFYADSIEEINNWLKEEGWQVAWDHNMCCWYLYDNEKDRSKELSNSESMRLGLQYGSED